MAGGDTGDTSADSAENRASINVENIFASMTPTAESTERTTVFRLDEPNNIFANFQPALLSSTPPRKYSDSNVESRLIFNTTSGRSDTGGVGKVAPDGELSKSMGTSFLRSGLQRSSSNVMANTFASSSIRHAGYLLKRSNLPYQPEPQPLLSDGIVENLVPPPPRSDGSGTEFDEIQHLPFGGFGSNNALFDGEQVDESASDMLETSPLKVAMNAGQGASVIDGSDNFATSEAPGQNDSSQCFCSPVVEFVRQLIGMQNETFVEEINGQHGGFMKVISSTATTPRRLSSNASAVDYYAGSVSNRYSLPLKEAGRSDPVPISPPKNKKVMTATDSLQRPTSSLPKTDSVGRLSTDDYGQQLSHCGDGKSTNYSPPPPDYLAKDGHIWRAKYCVLENGILYFYRTAAEGESHEAQLEREESRLYALETLSSEIFLGEEIVTSSSPSNQMMSPDTISLPKRQFTNDSMGRQLSRQMSNHDMHDLSKSPMPMKKAGYYMEQGQQARANPFSRQGSSVITGLTSNSTIGETGREQSGSSNNGGKLYHSNSTSTFNHDAEILWEKRVSLDCVGAVRSSKQDGDHVFELLAFGIEDRDEMSAEGGASASLRPSIDRQDSNEIVDRLILRAGGTDEMNAWMFELYKALRDRSMESFMQQVNSLKGGSRPSGFDDNSIHDISRCNTSPRDSMRRRLAPLNSQGSNVVGPAASPSIFTKSSYASSATAGGSSFGGSNFSPNVVGSLSHGHGRNALFRRQVRDGTTTEASPLSTPAGSPLDPSLLKKKPQIPSLSTSDTIQSNPSKGHGKKELSTLKDLRETKDRQSPSPILSKRPGAGSGKYIPPHQRNKAGTGKYVPPHLRNRQSNDGSTAEAALMNDKSKQSSAEIKIPPALCDSTEAPKSGDGSFDETLSDSSDISASSILGHQFGIVEEEFDSHIMRLGGCADPSVVVGSIIDAHFIPRDASAVGNARLKAYGGFGGGAYSPEPRNERMNPKGGVTSSSHRSALKWEIGASSECGVRTSNEDSYVAINNLDKLIETQGLVSFSSQDNFTQTKQQGLYAIFDGHVGNQAARFSAEKFPEILMEEQSLLASTDSASLSSIEERVDTMLRKSFDRLDRDFCVLCTTDGRNWDCGSTALVAVIVDDVVSLANLGDCRGVVGRVVATNNSETCVEKGWEEIDQHEISDDGRQWDRANGSLAPSYSRKLFWKEMTDTHSPIFAEEQARIERANGWIIEETEIPIGQLHRMDIFDKDVVEIVKRCFANRMKQHRSDPVRKLLIGRTCGDLAVSRAIGDRDFKAAYNSGTADEQEALPSGSWKGPDVFVYPEGHSRLFYGDIVSNTPDIRTFKVGSAGVLEEFLLMACDGLWDVMDSDDAVRIAKNLLYEKRLSAKDGAARLAELAQHLGSSDNITVILIRFYCDDIEDG